MQNRWTPERDEELKRHKAAGLSASRIAVLLNTTRGAILGRTDRLRKGPSQDETEGHKRQRLEAAQARRAEAAEIRRRAKAEKREKAAAEARAKEQARQHRIVTALQADLAAGTARDTAIARAIMAGGNSAAVAALVGLSPRRVREIAEAGRAPSHWTAEKIERLHAMWPDHTAQQIADILGVTRGAVLGKVWRHR